MRTAACARRAFSEDLREGSDSPTRARTPHGVSQRARDRALSTKRNEIVRVFRRLKGFRRTFCRSEDPTFSSLDSSTSLFIVKPFA